MLDMYGDLSQAFLARLEPGVLDEIQIEGEARRLGSLSYEARPHYIDELPQLPRSFLGGELQLDLLPHLRRLGPERACRALAILRFSSVMYSFVNGLHRDYDISLDLPSEETVSEWFHDPRFQYSRWREENQSSAVRRVEKPESRMKLIGAYFMSLPGDFYRAYEGMQDIGDLFVMGPSISTFCDLINTHHFIPPADSHVPGSVGYIRFHRVADAFIVTEIQSDMYGELPDRRLKEHFKHWSKLLLVAFEDYARSLPEDLRPQKIIVAGPEFLKRRWPRIDYDLPSIYGGPLCLPGISTSLAKRLYQRLPEELEYLPHEFPAFDIERAYMGEWVQLKSGMLRDIGGPPEESPFLSAFREHYCEGLEKRRGVEAWKYYQDMLETALPAAADRCSAGLREIEPGIESLFSAPVEGSVAVPATEMPLKTFAGISPFLLAARERLESRYALTEIPAKGPAMSVGSTNAAEEWSNLDGILSHEEYCEWLHMQDRERHPMTIHRRADVQAGTSSILSIGQKGGGVRDPNLVAELAHPIGGERLAIYHNPDRHVLHAQKYWGGLRLEEACREYLNILGVHMLMELVDPQAEPAVPIPYDVMKLDAVPVWDGDGVHFIEEREYARRYLEGTEHRFGILRTISTLDIRISQLMNRIFDIETSNGINILAIKQNIDNALGLVYLANGETFIRPDSLPGLGPAEAAFGMPEIMGYLKEIYELNKDAADRIVRSFETRSLKTIAAVHGASGHFGGCRLPHPGLNLPGAAMGGASTPRNMDVSGIMHDLDNWGCFPWAHNGVDYQRGTLGNAFGKLKHQKLLQHLDLLCWQDSVYWFRQIMRGRRMAEGQALQEYPFGRPGDLKWIIEEGVNPAEEEERRVVYPPWIMSISGVAAPFCKASKFGDKDANLFYAPFENSHRVKAKRIEATCPCCGHHETITYQAAHEPPHILVMPDHRQLYDEYRAKGQAALVFTLASFEELRIAEEIYFQHT